jgi:hypothetical protein
MTIMPSDDDFWKKGVKDFGKDILNTALYHSFHLIEVIGDFIPI